VRYLSGFNPETFKISSDRGSIEAKEIMDQAKKLGTKTVISNKTCSELSAFVLWRRVWKEMRLLIGLAGWQVHQLVREATGCATTGAKQVRHRGVDKFILCGCPVRKKGSSSKHLSYLRVSVF
jgi:hypothetical protein